MKITPRKSLKGVLFAGASILALNSGQASAVTITTNGCFNTNVSCFMSELLTDPTSWIQVDDKRFSNWATSSNDIGEDFGGMTVGGTENSGGIGLSFGEIGVSANASMGSETNDRETVTFDYKVSVVGAPMEIISNKLTLTGSSASGSEGAVGTADISEFLSTTNAFNNDIGIKSVFDTNEGADKPMDTLAFTGVSELFVRTQMRATANGTTESAGAASISSFTTTYGQQRIPEPASAALLGAGLAGLAGLRRRKKRV